MGAEKRRAKRVRIRDPRDFHENVLFDLSIGGLFVETSTPQPVGSAIRVELTPPGWRHSLPLDGRVIRVVPKDPRHPDAASGMAVQFGDLSPSVRRSLEEVVAACGETGDDPALARVTAMPTPMPAAGAPAGEPEPLDAARTEAAWLRERLAQEERRIADLEREVSRRERHEVEHVAQVIEDEEHKLREMLREESHAAAAEILRIRREADREIERLRQRLAEAEVGLDEVAKKFEKERAARIEAERIATVDRRARTQAELRASRLEESLRRIRDAVSPTTTILAAGGEAGSPANPRPERGKRDTRDFDETRVLVSAARSS